MSLPTDAHDFALWLFDNLEGASQVADTALWQGTLPPSLDFNQVATHLEDSFERLAGSSREDTRLIEFYPSRAHVYESMAELLATARNRQKIPDRFTIRESGCTYPLKKGGATASSKVTAYLDAIRLWSALEQLADAHNGGLLFVARHDAQITIQAELREADLLSLPDLSAFMEEFGSLTTHGDQKRSIVRGALIDKFRPLRSVTLAQVVEKFSDLAMDVRHALAMYMEEFSVQKVKAEVERQNVDDALSLNKTLSDIQNQLLALPAAILLAGATISPGDTLRNYAVLVGVIVFTIFVWMLVSNQRHSVDALAGQIEQRKAAVAKMPADSSARILELFKPLESRISRQRLTLWLIRIVVLAIVALTVSAVVEVNHPGTLLWLDVLHPPSVQE